MPQMPPTLRPPGARSKVERDREHDAKRRQDQPWRKWYGTKVWLGIRRRQLSIEPLCRRCLARDETVPATVVNHMERHHGVWEVFIAGPFESLCKPCHDGEVQREERAAER